MYKSFDSRWYLARLPLRIAYNSQVFALNTLLPTSLLPSLWGFQFSISQCYMGPKLSHCVARKMRRAPIAESSFEHVDAVVAFRGVPQGRASGAQGAQSRGGDGPWTQPLPLQRARESRIHRLGFHRQGNRPRFTAAGASSSWSGGVQPVSGKIVSISGRTGKEHG